MWTLSHLIVKHLAEDLGLGFGLHYVHIQGMPGMAIYGYSTSKLEIQVMNQQRICKCQIMLKQAVLETYGQRGALHSYVGEVLA